jgi:hypothetical protein
MTLDDLRASAPPELVAYLDSQNHAFARFERDDDSRGVQARMNPPMTEVFMLCFVHEKQRMTAKGVAPNILLAGVTGMLAMLLSNLVRNMFDEEDYIQALGPICEALMRGAAKAMSSEPSEMFIRAAIDTAVAHA